MATLADVAVSPDIPASQTGGVDALSALYAEWSEILATLPGLSMRMMRSLFEEWHQPATEPEDVTYKDDTLGGVPGIWALPIGADSSQVLLYTHGGGFAVGSAASHRKLAGHLAKALGVTAFVLEYRRAPEHTHPAQLQDGVAVFTALVAGGVAPENITTIGDSAGGNLAVAIPLALRERGKPLPGRVIALSPWLDMENNVTNVATDKLITRELLAGMIAGVLGTTVAPKNPLANPLYADFSEFPRLYINAGAAETLADNATRLADRARAAGVDVTCSVVHGMQHVFLFLAGRGSQADEEIARIARWYTGER